MSGEDAPRAFILISFESSFDAVYERLIAEPLEALGYVVERADSRLDQDNILRKIVRGIASADLIVADLTGLNPNVFYELGIAHALDIPTILLTQDLQTLPFDLRSYTANEYSVHFAEAPKIVETIREIGAAHLKDDVVFGSPVKDFLPSELRERLGKGPRKPVPSAAGATGEVENESERDGMAGELGFLDLELQAMEAGDQFSQAMNAVTHATEEVGAHVVAHTAELEALTLNPGPQSVKAANLLAIRMAASLDASADELQARLPDIQGGAAKLMDSINRRVALWKDIEGAADEDQLRTTRETLSEMRATTSVRVSEVRTFRDSVLSVRGFSRHVNSAASRIVGGLNALLAVSENVEAQTGRAVAVIDDLLEELAERA